jgi:hypothetical protein
MYSIVVSWMPLVNFRSMKIPQTEKTSPTPLFAMPKVRTKRTVVPDGFDVVEPVLQELETKMREGTLLYLQSNHLPGKRHPDRPPPAQPRLLPTRGNVNPRPSGPSLASTTNDRGTSTKCSIKSRRFRGKCMITASVKATLMRISLPSGANQASIASVVSAAHRLKTTITELRVFVAFLGQNLTRVAQSSAQRVDAGGAPVAMISTH